MLRTTCPNISIITNFGCRANCWYCIWKGHPLENVNPPTDWVKLENFLTYHKNKDKVSLSGGGDCLYNYKNYSKWWDNLFSITNNLGMLVDVHTREKFTNLVFWQKINRCVFSSDNLENDRKYLEFLASLVKVRITHLVTKNTTIDLINKYLDFQKSIKCQFTIKELVKYDDGGMYKLIRNKFPEIYHLDAGDYNIYYMPDNIIRDTFLF